MNEDMCKRKEKLFLHLCKNFIGVTALMPNIEIKATYEDGGKAREIAVELQALYQGRDHQVDTYFQTKAGRLKLRESSLSGAQMIPYLRSNTSAPKFSDYLLLPVDQPTELKRLLSEMFGVDVVVDKERDIYLWENVRIHLDHVRGLGSYLEFEAVFRDDTPAVRLQEQAKVEELIQCFGIREEMLVSVSYQDLVKQNFVRDQENFIASL